MSTRIWRRAAAAITLVATLLGSTQACAANAEPAPPPGCDIVAANEPAKRATEASAALFPPPQLDMRTPLEPTVLPSGGRNFLFYEVHLRNFADDPMTLRAIEVLDGSADKGQALAVLTTAQLKQRLRLVGPDDKDGQPRLAGGQGAVVYLCLGFDAKVAVPATLRHRIVLDGATVDGPLIGTHTTRLKVLGRPLEGPNWSADNGPSIESHHRMGLFLAGGVAHLARRYAVDWKIYRDGEIYAGDALDVRSYFAYGKTVLAVADGEVVQARDGLPNNIPRTKAGFKTALPVTLDTVAGNFVVLALGDGQYAQYVHLQPGSVRVKAGERVRRGDVLGRVGASGDARVPHLHFQVADNPDILASEGLPHVFDQYRLKTADGQWQARSGEFPLGEAVIDFGAPTRAPRN